MEGCWFLQNHLRDESEMPPQGESRVRMGFAGPGVLVKTAAVRSGGVLMTAVGMAGLLFLWSCRNDEGSGGEEAGWEGGLPRLELPEERGEAGAEPGARGFLLCREENMLPAGATGRLLMRVTMLDATVRESEEGKNRLGRVSNRSRQAYGFEVRSKDELVFECTADTSEQERNFDGIVDAGPETVGPMQGEVVRLVRAGEGWAGRLRSPGEATAGQDEEIRKLEKLFDPREALAVYGAERREVGEEWEVDPDSVPGLTGGAQYEGTCRMRFDEVTDFNGLRCARIEGRVDVVGGEGFGVGSSMEIRFRGSCVIHRSLDYFVNLSEVFTGEMVVTGGRPGEGVSKTVRGPVTIMRNLTLSLPDGQ